MKLRYTILYVENVAKSMNLYDVAFGLTRGFIHEGGDYGEMVTGETKLAFAAKELIAQTGKGVGVADPLKPVFEIAFETDDVERAFKTAVKAGAVSQKEPTQMPWDQTVSFVSDPDGILIEICSPVAGSA